MLKDNILRCLLENQNGVVTGGELAKKFGVSRTAVWKAIGALKGEGTEIEVLRNSGYRLIEPGDALSECRIRASLNARVFGSLVEILGTTVSTSGYIKDKAVREGASLPEGFAVLAEEQTGGRGRFGRSFACERGQGVYLSFLLRPSIPVEEAPFLTICAAVAVSNALCAVCGFEPRIKWVNDIYYDDRKLCGILTEAVISAEAGAFESVVIGIGVNTGRLPEGAGGAAISVAEITGKTGFRNALAAEILNRFEKTYTDFTRHDGRQAILRDYASRQCVLGRRVTVLAPGFESYEATPERIDEAGRLVVVKDDGTRVSLNSGEVSLKMGGTSK